MSLQELTCAGTPNSSNLHAPAFVPYDPELYRSEIDRALARAKRILAKNESDFVELLRDVELEIWCATLQYGQRMNEKLAFTIARNKAGAFLRKRIAFQTVQVIDADGNPVLDEFGVAQGLDGVDLKRQSEDPEARPEARQRAKRLLNEYQLRYPRYLSIDEGFKKKEDWRKRKGKRKGERKEQEEDGGVTPAEREILRIQDRTPRFLQSLLARDEFHAIQEIARTWSADKKRVWEAIQDPDFTVRSVLGMDKSKVSRIRRSILKEIKAFLTRSYH